MNYFNLFSNILITIGIRRILITDLQRDNSELFPLELNDLIIELSEKSIEDVINSYDIESQDFVKEYINILLEKEYGFISQKDWDKNFPPFSYEFLNPNEITNAFLEIEDLNVLNKIASSIADLGTEHVVIYYNKILLHDEFIEIDKQFKNTSVKSIQVFSLYSNDIDEPLLLSIDKFCSRIYSLVFYSCNIDLPEIVDQYKFTVTITKENIKLNSCGKVDLKYFNTSLPKVLEAINYNSCLHKKISIDKNGDIRNCPAMLESFGNIDNRSLLDALKHPNFKQYWSLTKNDIEVCNICEFRYICTDCRAFTERTHINLIGLDVSKPLKCGYNPNTGEWQEWSTSPLKQIAIEFYQMKNDK